MRRSIRSKASIPWTDEGFASQALHCLLCVYEVFAGDRHRALAVLSDSGGTPSGASAPNASDPYKEHRRERFLSPEEYRRLGRVLREAETSGRILPSGIAAIRLLVLTGWPTSAGATWFRATGPSIDGDSAHVIKCSRSSSGKPPLTKKRQFSPMLGTRAGAHLA